MIRAPASMAQKLSCSAAIARQPRLRCALCWPRRRPRRHGARSCRNAWPRLLRVSSRPLGKASGPTAQDLAAAQSMSPEERQAMICSMVDRLAARLEQNPSDKDGWTRLAHAYDVLGETEKAEAARTRAAQVPETGK